VNRLGSTNPNRQVRHSCCTRVRSRKDKASLFPKRPRPVRPPCRRGSTRTEARSAGAAAQRLNTAAITFRRSLVAGRADRHVAGLQAAGHFSKLGPSGTPRPSPDRPWRSPRPSTRPPGRPSLGPASRGAHILIALRATGAGDGYCRLGLIRLIGSTPSADANSRA
jgi:hypothetical protein